MPVRGRWRRQRTSATGGGVAAIGDVHGRWDLLRALIIDLSEKFRSSLDMPLSVVVLGDFVDRGPAVHTVVEFLRQLTHENSGAIVLRGNHEAALLASARGNGDAQRLWLAFGGDATLRNYHIDPPHPTETAREFAVRLADGIGHA